MNNSRNSRFAPGITLIEVGIALFIIIISVAFSLRLMANLVTYAGREGQTIDITRAVALGQAAAEIIRDRPLPPTSYMERLALDGEEFSLDDPYWNDLFRKSEDHDAPFARFDDPAYDPYRLSISVLRPGAGGEPVPVTTAEFDHSARVDRLGVNSLLLIQVDVYRGPTHLFRAETYKARHGYY